MKPVALALAVIGLVAAVAGYRLYDTARADRFIHGIRNGLVYVPSGTFEAGNYQARYLLQDGTTETRWVIDPQLALPPHPVTLQGYYLQDREASNADFNRFLAAKRLPQVIANEAYDIGLPDKAANMALHEAQAYCAWLGEMTGLPMRLPTEAEWEFAARSRGLTPPWATADGEFRAGQNVVDNSRDATQPNPPVASFPPNPLGFYNMADGRYEWIADTAATDPEGVRIAKGGSNTSSTRFETIPGRYVVEGTEELLPGHPFAERMTTHPGPIHIAGATARCAVEDDRPPSQSGFGRSQTVDPAQLRPAFGPYDRHGMLRP